MNLQRVPTIDFIRGLCILAVILLHINIRLHFDQLAWAQHISPTILKIFLWSGYYGVIVFFVVSGFLITTTSLNRWGSLSQIVPREFYWIRFSRIAPCLLAILIFLIILHTIHVKNYVIAPQKASLSQATLSALTFQLNWLEAKRGYLPGAWDVLWSLSVEEMFYFFFPLICQTLKKERYFILCMLLFIIIGPFSRTVLSHNEIWQDHAYLSCMDGIALGCLAALWANKYKLAAHQLTIINFLGLALTLFILIFRKQVALLGLTTTGLNVTVLEIGIAFLLISFYQRPLQKNSSKSKWAHVITWFGKNSYEIYLSHMFVVITMTGLFLKWYALNTFMVLAYGTIVLLSGLLGALIARFYSIPMNHFLRSLL